MPHPQILLLAVLTSLPRVRRQQVLPDSVIRAINQHTDPQLSVGLSTEVTLLQRFPSDERILTATGRPYTDRP
jgi:hypothetical protein